MKEKEFEKLWMTLKNTNYELADIAIANCPDDWSFCSIIISAIHEKGSSFVHAITNREEAEKIRDAISKVIEDMPPNGQKV